MLHIVHCSRCHCSTLNLTSSPLVVSVSTLELHGEFEAQLWSTITSFDHVFHLRKRKKENERERKKIETIKFKSCSIHYGWRQLWAGATNARYRPQSTRESHVISPAPQHSCGWQNNLAVKCRAQSHGTSTRQLALFGEFVLNYLIILTHLVWLHNYSMAAQDVFLCCFDVGEVDSTATVVNENRPVSSRDWIYRCCA